MLRLEVEVNTLEEDEEKMDLLVLEEEDTKALLLRRWEVGAKAKEALAYREPLLPKEEDAARRMAAETVAAVNFMSCLAKRGVCV
jgi:hypothetical protein